MALKGVTEYTFCYNFVNTRGDLVFADQYLVAILMVKGHRKKETEAVETPNYLLNYVDNTLC